MISDKTADRLELQAARDRPAASGPPRGCPIELISMTLQIDTDFHVGFWTDFACEKS